MKHYCTYKIALRSVVPIQVLIACLFYFTELWCTGFFR